MKVSRFSGVFTVGMILGVFLCVAAQSNSRPNILVILLDDSGYRDLGCFGSEIETPHIDRLAAEGMVFTDCHSAAPNCSPARAGLLTGRIPIRCGIYSYLPEGHVMHLKEEEVTIAEMLKEEGYRTGHFGKWHLSRLNSEQAQPTEQGFDYSFGTDNNAVPSHRNPKNFVRNGNLVGELEGYSCHLVVDEAVRWMKTGRGQAEKSPFLACVWFHEPHSPIASPDSLIVKYQQRYPQYPKKRATYYANIENVDLAVGKLLNTLKELGHDEDTFVFLTSDNGPVNAFSKGELRGRKSHVYEGGHRVPGIVRWPGQVEPGSRSKVPIGGVDLFPTIKEIVGSQIASAGPVDGVSWLPLFKGKALERQTPLFWFFYRLNPAAAMRFGNYTLIGYSNDSEREKTHPLVNKDMPHIKNVSIEAIELFDLASDLPQTANLYGETETHLELGSRFESLLQEVVKEGENWEIPENYGAGSVKKRWLSK